MIPGAAPSDEGMALVWLPWLWVAVGKVQPFFGVGFPSGCMKAR